MSCCGSSNDGAGSDTSAHPLWRGSSSSRVNGNVNALNSCPLYAGVLVRHPRSCVSFRMVRNDVFPLLTSIAPPHRPWTLNAGKPSAMCVVCLLSHGSALHGVDLVPPFVDETSCRTTAATIQYYQYIRSLPTTVVHLCLCLRCSSRKVSWTLPNEKLRHV